ncbi:MAG: Ig domain-containing protein, partial [Actinomycetota bacterium]|nr:Ig domain-containing protein [Actinomycetota bacterium]
MRRRVSAADAGSRRGLTRNAGDEGFVLLESIVAIAVVTIVVAGLSALFVSTSQTTNHLRIRQAAIQLADSGVDTVRAYAPGTVQNGRDPDTVEDQYRTGIASTAPSALSAALRMVADPYPAMGSATVGPQPTVPAACTAGVASVPLPVAPVCQAVGSRAFLMSYYLGNCYVRTSKTACDAAVPTDETFVKYLRAVVAVRWSNDHCTSSSCSYVTSTLINNNADPRFDINHGGAESPFINAPNLTSNVGDTGPFAAPTLRTGSGVAPFTWAATGLPDGLTMTTDGTIKGTIAPQAGGTVVYLVKLTVVDGLINRQAGSFNWTVRQPTIASPGDQSTVINTPVSLPVAATCWTTPCVYALVNGPAWATINATTGVISGTPTVVGTASDITVTISDGHNPKVTATTDPFDWVIVPIPAAVCVSDIALTNGSFEDPNSPFVLRGAPNWMAGGQAPLLWDTTEADNVIELWKNDNASGGALPLTAEAANGGQPISAQDGTQWAELNANATGALYQNLTTTPGVTLQWSVWHRGRYSAGIGSKKDVMRVQIGSTTVQQDQAATNVATGVTAADISDDWTAWRLYRGFYVVPAGQTTTRFQFAAISTASGDNSIGNFIDNLSLNNRVACVQQLPDPQTSTIGVAIKPLQLAAIRGSGNFQWGGGGTLPVGLTMSTTGLISGTPTTLGARSVVLTLTDTQTSYTTNVPFTWTVVARPTIAAPSTQTTSVGGVVSLQVSSTCPNKPCTYSLTNGPSGLSVSNTGLITGTDTSSAQTFSATTITVRDSAGATATTAAFTWRVIGGPVITSPGDQKTLRGATVSLDMAARASGGIGSYVYTSTTLPPWLAINRSTGLITGVAPSSQESTTVGIRITVTDGMNASSSTAAFNWIVYSGPVVTAPVSQSSTIGAPVSLPVAFTCQNPPCTFTITGQPSGLSINNSGVITGTVGGQPQIYGNVRVSITDAAGASARSSAFTWTVSYPPLQASQADLVSTLNTAITPLQLVASGGSGSYSWSGSPPTGLTMTAAGRVTGSPSPLRSGPVILTVTDTVTGNIMPVTFNWAVVAKPTVAAPASQVTSVGASANLTVPGLTCPNSPCTVVLTNGPPGLGITGGVITGTVGGSAFVFGNVTITVTDAAGAIATSTFTWTV